MKTTWNFASTVILPAGFALTLLMGWTATASAQSYGSQPTPGYGFGHAFGGYNHASTLEEGVLRGAADLTRARGEANYWHSLAAINGQEAQARYLQNRQAATETYFNMRQINRDARNAERGLRLSPNHYAAIARKMAPDRLANHQYDRTLGRLNWPAVLTSKYFAAEREVLDGLFAARSPGDSGVGSLFSSNVKELTKSLDNKLKEHVDFLPQMEYIAAKKFIASVGYEAQQPLVVEAVAAAE